MGKHSHSTKNTSFQVLKIKLESFRHDQALALYTGKYLSLYYFRPPFHWANFKLDKIKTIFTLMCFWKSMYIPIVCASSRQGEKTRRKFLYTVFGRDLPYLVAFLSLIDWLMTTWYFFCWLGFVSEGEFFTNNCQWNPEYLTLEPHQRRGIRYMYERGCNCTVSHARI